MKEGQVKIGNCPVANWSGYEITGEIVSFIMKWGKARGVFWYYLYVTPWSLEIQHTELFIYICIDNSRNV